MKNQTPKKIIIIGGGSRGGRYSDEMKRIDGAFSVVAVAEPIEDRREHLCRMWDIPAENCEPSWEGLLEREKYADGVVIATMDRDHLAPALKAIEKGYDILLEKPMSATPEECALIARAAREKGVSVLVCHVLRYTLYFNALKGIIDSGRLGQIIHIQHAECVGNVHQSHSFVRGNWGNSDRSSCMILQKCCHDMDIIQWLLGKDCTRVHSFGSLSYFKKENAPEGAPDYCIEGCPIGDTCPYNAVKLYYDDKKNDWFRPAAAGKVHPTDDDIEEAIRTTNYGKCVFKCDNNVVDHQTVNLEFEDGATVSFTMCAFNQGARHTRIMGTKGELTAGMGAPTVDIYNFETKQHETVQISEYAMEQSITGGHGGGDTGITHAFADMLRGDTSRICSLDETYRNHLIAFAAEESRITGTVVDMKEYAARFEK